MKRRWWLVGSGGLALALAGCNAGEGESCATYACINTVTMSGSVAVDHPVQQLLATMCIGSDCHSFKVDVTHGEKSDCWPQADEDVCADQVGDKVELTAVWDHGYTAAPIKGVKHSILLEDAETHEILLERQSVVNGEITHQDNCHTCWSAELKL